MYNAENHIINCLNSLINQGLSDSDYEIMIMDDGSRDDSVKLVSNFIRYKDNFYLFEESNSGSDSTRNKLLKKAKGEYIYFIDADDYLADNVLAKLLDYAVKNKIDFIGFDTLETNNLNEFGLEEGFVTSFDQLKIISGNQFIKENRHLRHEVWWYLVKKDLLVKHDICFDENGNNADVVFTIKILLNVKKMIFCPFAVHRYIQTTTSVMRDTSVEKRRKLIDSMYLMIISYSKLILSLETGILNDKEIILENLKFRRDVFAFFNIINMVKLNYRAEDFQKKINQLSEVNSYPINNFLKDHYNNSKYIVINKIINNKPILLSLMRVRNMFLF
jgi:glycosyltransferase involved in cell wall biosynthesis